MTEIIARDLDELVIQRLRAQALSHGNSLDEEVRGILRNAVLNESNAETGLGTRISAMFALDGFDSALPESRGGAVRATAFEL